MWKWIKKNVLTKKMLGVAIGAAGAAYPPALPFTLIVGALVTGSDFQIGSKVGTPLGAKAKELLEEVKAANRKKAGK